MTKKKRPILRTINFSTFLLCEILQCRKVKVFIEVCLGLPRVNAPVEVTALLSGREGYIKKSSWNRFIMVLLDRNKTTKEHDIDTNDGLKTDFRTVGGSVHKEEARMSKGHDKFGESIHKQSKEVEYDFDVS